MTVGPVLPRALAAGAAAGLVAAAVAIVPALGSAGDTRLADYAALLVVILGTLGGLRHVVVARPHASFADRLAAMAASAGAACAVLAAGLWRLYAVWRPALLEDRYQAVVVTVGRRSAPALAEAALADLVARKAQYLDPLFQALSGAVTAFFFATLVGGYAVFRWRVAARVARAPRSSAS
ncbi:MAG: hypothetical protein WCJ30_24245 [Deltaproteobacteria bacterium]